MSKCKDDARSIEVAEIAAIMKTSGGRNVIRRLIASTGYFGDTFNQDPHTHAYNAGRRSIGLTLVSQFKEAAPGEFETMLKEHFRDE